MNIAAALQKKVREDHDLPSVLWAECPVCLLTEKEFRLKKEFQLQTIYADLGTRDYRCTDCHHILHLSDSQAIQLTSGRMYVIRTA